MDRSKDRQPAGKDLTGSTDREWRGLAGLSTAIRQELAGTVLRRAAASLESCLKTTLSEWQEGKLIDTKAEAYWMWAHDLGPLLTPIKMEFADALANDLKTTRYPPEYGFSGVAFADGGSDLMALDDYQSTRRSLRHELEAAVKSHRYSAFILRQAAVEDHRFQYPNWAPWSPVHWFERLMEIAERHFGKTPKSLELARSYANCLAKSGANLLPDLAADIDALGLVTLTEDEFETESTSGYGSSWRNLVGSGTRSGKPIAANRGADGRLPAPDGDDEQGRKPSRDPHAPSAPQAGADEAQWLRWVRNMLQVVGGSSHGPHGPVAATPVSAAEGSPAFVEPVHVIRGELVQPAGDVQDPRASLAPFVLDLLQGLFDHIFRQTGFNPKVRAAISDMQYGLARAVIRDLSFFRDRSHPLRLWIGSLINTGLRISPHESSLDGELVHRYLARIERSVTRLRAEAEDMDHEGAQSLLDEWLAGIAEDGALWEEQHESNIQALEHNEHLARAWRSLRACVMETDASLPLEAAERIAKAWSDLLAMEEGGTGTLHNDMKAIVEGICRKALPIDVNPMVNQLVTDALEEGFPNDRIRSVVTHLAKAHLQHSRAGPNTARFDPNAIRQRHGVLRFEDDDPDLPATQDEESLYHASRIRVGDWFEFLARDSGDVQRMALIWRGEASRGFLFLSLDGTASRRHSLHGVAQEFRAGRMRYLPQDNPLDTLIR